MLSVFPESDQVPLPETHMRWPSPISWLVAVVVLLAVLLLLLPIGNRSFVTDRNWAVDKANGEMDQLMNALEVYRAEYGAFPNGNDRDVCRALQGANPKKIVYVEFGQRSVTANGDLLDPWGTPYKFYFSNADLLIRSAGRNKKFESSNKQGGDDYFKGDTK